jgi:hypothetical protein
VISPIREIVFKGGFELEDIICHNKKINHDALLQSGNVVISQKPKKIYSFALIITWFEGKSTGNASLKIPHP